MEIGDRIANVTNGEVGFIEILDEDGFVSYRNLTPKNVPSCCMTTTELKNLVIVPETVIPMPRSKKWHEESKEFCKLIADALERE
jgi:hypothetical protein